MSLPSWADVKTKVDREHFYQDKCNGSQVYKPFSDLRKECFYDACAGDACASNSFKNWSANATLNELLNCRITLGLQGSFSITARVDDQDASKITITRAQFDAFFNSARDDIAAKYSFAT